MSKRGVYPFVDMDHLYESMVCRDDGGIQPDDAFGRAFLTLLRSPCLFGEAKAYGYGITATSG